MNLDEYRKAFVVNPRPKPRFKYTGRFNVTLFYEAYEAAVAYYTAVLGPPAYVEGGSTRGWEIGEGWLTLLRGKEGNPKNIEIMFEVEGAKEAEQMQKAFIQAGGTGPEPSDELMYHAVRYCPARDPFGVDILVFSRLE